MTTRSNLSAELENFVDKESLTDLLEVIENICYEKSEHVRSTWQDEDLADDWETAANEINKTIGEISHLSPPIGD